MGRTIPRETRQVVMSSVFEENESVPAKKLINALFSVCIRNMPDYEEFIVKLHGELPEEIAEDSFVFSHSYCDQLQSLLKRRRRSVERLLNVLCKNGYLSTDGENFSLTEKGKEKYLEHKKDFSSKADRFRKFQKIAKILELPNQTSFRKLKKIVRNAIRHLHEDEVRSLIGMRKSEIFGEFHTNFSTMPELKTHQAYQRKTSQEAKVKICDVYRKGKDELRLLADEMNIQLPEERGPWDPSLTKMRRIIISQIRSIRNYSEAA